MDRHETLIASSDPITWPVMKTLVLPIRVVAVGFVLALGLASCGSSPSTSSTTTSGVACDTGPTATVLIPPADQSPAGTSGTAPTLVVPSSAPPTQLECADLIVGTGASAKVGSKISVQYVLGTYSTHQTIQSSWTSAPYQFTLGEGQVIAGWDQGVVGMKVGGRRELIIPPSLGYMDQAQGGGIAANDTLVFIIDLLSSN